MVTIIVAHDKKNGISKNGTIPWHFDLDRSFFEDVTTRIYHPEKKNALIVGRKTWEKMKKMNLQNRIFIVVSRTMLNSNQLYVQSNPKDAFEFATSMDVAHIFICGGSSIYSYFLQQLPEFINQILRTQIDSDYECDNFVPHPFIPENFFHEESKSFTLKNNIKLTFDLYTHEYNFLSHSPEHDYLSLLYDLIEAQNENLRETRNGLTSSLFARTLSYDLQKDGFPLLTTKKVLFRGIFEELLFFLRGQTNSKILEEKKINIWKENTKLTGGDMGPLYGFQWLHFGETYQPREKEPKYGGFNQIEYCLHLLKTDPYSRRIIMSSYNPAQASQGVLYPCHSIHVQFYVDDKKNRLDPHSNRFRFLSCLMTQRSADICCGVPWNIASYALLIHLICNVLNHSPDYNGPTFFPGRLIIVLGDVHLYKEHQENAMRQVLRTPYSFPNLTIKRKMKSLTDVSFEDIELIKYNPFPSLDFKMVV